MTINGKTVETCGKFAYDGCHKIYVCETEEDVAYMRDELGYEILPIEEIERTYVESCPLKFIYNVGLDVTYVAQAETAVFGDQLDV